MSDFEQFPASDFDEELRALNDALLEEELNYEFPEMYLAQLDSVEYVLSILAAHNLLPDNIDSNQLKTEDEIVNAIKCANNQKDRERLLNALEIINNHAYYLVLNKDDPSFDFDNELLGSIQKLASNTSSFMEREEWLRVLEEMYGKLPLHSDERGREKQIENMIKADEAERLEMELQASKRRTAWLEVEAMLKSEYGDHDELRDIVNSVVDSAILIGRYCEIGRGFSRAMFEAISTKNYAAPEELLQEIAEKLSRIFTPEAK